jgi:phosphomannomutase
MLSPTIFKSYDVRAIYGTELDAEGWDEVVKGTYAYLQKTIGKEALVINVSHDMRTESQAIYERSIPLLTSLGATVQVIGLASTPLSYFGLLHLRADASFQHTASHNPSGYTGLKCVWRDGERVIKVSGTALKSSVLHKEFSSPKSGGSVKVIHDLVDNEAQAAVANVLNRAKKFRVIADTANGMGSTYLHALARLLPLDISYLNETLDGTFPGHLSDTLQHDLWKDLQRYVVEQNADFGIATDGDGDRVAFVDEKGRFVPCTLITCLIIDALNQQQSGETYLVDIRSILHVKNFLTKIGAQMHTTKVGHANITADMHTTGSPFGGESSGHYFFKSTGGAESTMRVIAAVYDMLNKSNLPLSQLLETYNTAHMATETNFIMPKDVSRDAIFSSLQTQLTNAQISLLDGITFEYDTWRSNIRTSNTEPLLRLNTEANTSLELEEKHAYVKKLILATGCTLATGH